MSRNVHYNDKVTEPDQLPLSVVVSFRCAPIEKTVDDISTTISGDSTTPNRHVMPETGLGDIACLQEPPLDKFLFTHITN